MSVVLPYNELHSNLTPEQNAAALEKVAQIIKQQQLRSIGHEEITYSIQLQEVRSNPAGAVLNTQPVTRSHGAWEVRATD